MDDQRAQLRKAIEDARRHLAAELSSGFTMPQARHIVEHVVDSILDPALAASLLVTRERQLYENAQCVTCAAHLDAAVETPATTDDARAQLRALLDSVERALRAAYTGSAEHGSFFRHGGGEYVPSVFLLMNNLRREAASLLVDPAGVTPSEAEQRGRVDWDAKRLARIEADLAKVDPRTEESDLRFLFRKIKAAERERDNAYKHGKDMAAEVVRLAQRLAVLEALFRKWMRSTTDLSHAEIDALLAQSSPAKACCQMARAKGDAVCPRCGSLASSPADKEQL